MLFFSVFEVVGFAANISRAEICPFFDLELDALTLSKKRGTFTFIQLVMSTKILFLCIVREIPKVGEKSMIASCGYFTGIYQSVPLKGRVLNLSQH